MNKERKIRIYLESGEKGKQRERNKEGEREKMQRNLERENRPMAGNTFPNRQRCVCVM